jgi:DNA repair protein RadA/Sms
MGSFTVEQIPPQAPRRIATGIPELDWIYGWSLYDNGYHWGLPKGKISLWAGEGGVGKSRASITVGTFLANAQYKVLYFQNEVDLPTFSGWVREGIIFYNLFLMSEDIGLQDQLDTIRRDKPQIVVVDSINRITEFGSGAKKNIELIINEYRKVCKELNVHVIFLCQLNQDGSIKGSTTLKHLVDIELNIVHAGAASHFVIKTGKHRYGRTGEMFRTLWEHTDLGVRSVSEHRLEDEVWCTLNGVAMKVYTPESANVAPRKKFLGIF